MQTLYFTRKLKNKEKGSIRKTSRDTLKHLFVPTVQIDVTQMGDVFRGFSTLAEQEFSGLHCQARPTGAHQEVTPCRGQGQEAGTSKLPLKGPESVNLQQL